MAQQIVKHPAHPMDFGICWNDALTNAGKPINWRLEMPCWDK